MSDRKGGDMPKGKVLLRIDVEMLVDEDDGVHMGLMPHAVRKLMELAESIEGVHYTNARITSIKRSGQIDA